MPTRRVWRFKTRVEPLTDAQWAFFLVEDVAGFERLVERDGASFFLLYYFDGWREIYAAHRDAIEAEWSKRGWSKKQKQFVLTPYLQRGYRLKHDVERERRMGLWEAWRKAEGWKTESWEQHLERNGIPKFCVRHPRRF